MVKSLVINCSLNKEAKIEELLAAVGKVSQYLHVRFEEINAGYEIEKDIDAIILSGSKARIVDPSHREQFEETIDAVLRFNLPTLGICFGHQLLCWSLGCEVGFLSKPAIDLFENVRVIEPKGIFAGFSKQELVPLAESHFDYVTRNSLDRAGLVLLADSPSCEVEAVRHKKKPFYGAQFHPERISMKGQKHSEGHKVISNFFDEIVGKVQ